MNINMETVAGELLKEIQRISAAILHHRLKRDEHK
jgi:hypothetical protein